MYLDEKIDKKLVEILEEMQFQTSTDYARVIVHNSIVYEIKINCVGVK